MATLSFSCPKCSKLHSRIKPEMVGHKVKCQCGFVFRLGSKTDKQPGVADDLKRKRALRARKEATRSKRQASPPVAPVAPAPSFEKPRAEDKLQPAEMEPILEPIAVDDEILEPIALGDEILEPVQLADEILGPGDLVPADGGGFSGPVLDAVPIAAPASLGQPAAGDPFADPFADPLASGGQNQYSPGLSPARAPVRKPSKKKRSLRPGETRLQSNAGPIVSLIVNFFALLAMTVVTSIFLFAFIGLFNNDNFQTPRDSSRKVISMLTGGVMLLSSLLLTISIFASGATAIMELIQQRLIVWAHKTSAILATLFMFAIFVMMCVGIARLMMALGQIENAGGNSGRAQAAIGAVVVTAIFTAIAMGIAPLAVAITGFVRSRK